MGRTDIRGDRTKKWVTPFNQCIVRYGFSTNLDTAESGELGHQALPTTIPQGPQDFVYFGLQSPKPSRYSKKQTAYSVSSFLHAGTQIDLTKWKKVKQGGYKRVAARTNAAGFGRKPVYVPYGTIGYAWQMDTRTYELIAQWRAALGIADVENSASALKKLIWGANKAFKPPVAHYFDSALNTSYNVFVNPELTSLPQGWSFGGMVPED